MGDREEGKKGRGIGERERAPFPFPFLPPPSPLPFLRLHAGYPFLPCIKKLPLYTRCYRAFAWSLEATKCIGGKQTSKQVMTLNKLDKLSKKKDPRQSRVPSRNQVITVKAWINDHVTSDFGGSFYSNMAEGSMRAST